MEKANTHVNGDMRTPWQQQFPTFLPQQAFFVSFLENNVQCEFLLRKQVAWLS